MGGGGSVKDDMDQKDLTNKELDKVTGGGIADQFAGIPMSELIGGPLKAARDAQEALARSTAEFIERAGMKTRDMADKQ